MAGVGYELTHLGFALVTRGEGLLDVAEEPVERCADLPDLGAGVGVDCRHPFGQVDLATSQW